jgi:MFS family permease
LLIRRHFWRYASFDEVARLYSSRFLITFALNLVSMFAVVYMYNLGYSVLTIMAWIACFYAVKVPISFVAAKYVAKFGPKHGIFLANLSYIPALVFFSFIPEPSAAHGIVMLALYGVTWAFGTTLYDYSYLVNFSKVKHAKHAGKELGFMQIVEKIGAVTAPVIGGLIATWWGPVTAAVTTAVLLAVAAIPLLQTGEPTRLNQKLRIVGFPWRTTWRSMVAEAGVGMDVVASGSLWSLFLVAVVVAAGDNGVYAFVGALSALGMASGFIVAFICGKLIDRRRGAALLKYGVLFNSLGHMLRAATAGGAMAAVVNVTSQTATTAYGMAFTRGMFDTADYSGFRLTYLLCMEVVVNVGAALAGGLAFLIAYLLDFELKLALPLFFVTMALATLVISAHGFKLYKHR